MRFNSFIFIYVLLAISVIASCKKEKFDISNLNGDEIIVLGHGGMGNKNIYPMNSFESIQRCLTMPVDGVEVDLQMTKDSVLVAFHDYDLSDKTSLNGLVNEYTWEEIKDASYLFGPYLDYNIVSLDEIFSNIKNINRYVFSLDCKLYTLDEDVQKFRKTFLAALLRLIDGHGISENVFIEVSDTDFLQMLKKERPYLKLFIHTGSFEEGLNIAKTMNLHGIVISTRSVSREQIEEAHENNLYVSLFDASSNKSNEEAIRKNPDIIQTDDVENILDLLRR